MLQIRVIADGRTLALTGKTVIGSGPGAGLVLADPSVKPTHCVLSGSGTRFLLMALDPTADVKVNGEKASQKSVKAGDRLTVGTVELLIEAAAPSPAAATAPVTAPASAPAGSAAPQPSPAPPAGEPRGRADAMAGSAAAGGPPIPLSLEVKSGPGQGKVYPLAPGRNTFGRAPGNSVVLPDPYVSGNHGEIRVEDGRLHWRDVGSRTGSKVNGIKVDAVEVSDGDEIEIGRTVMAVRVRGPIPVGSVVAETPPDGTPLPAPAAPLAAMGKIAEPEAAPAPAMGGAPDREAPALRDDVAPVVPTGAPAAAAGPRLVVVSGAAMGREVPVAEGRLTIGRTADNALVLPDPGVADHHAMFVRDGARLEVRALGSAPMRVNGIRVEAVVVSEGDEIQLAETAVRLRGVPAAATRVLEVPRSAPAPVASAMPIARPAEAAPALPSTVPLAVPIPLPAATPAAAPKPPPVPVPVPDDTPAVAWSLLGLGGEVDGRIFLLAGRTTIGSAEGATIRLTAGDKVAAEHAEILERPTGPAIRLLATDKELRVQGAPVDLLPLAHGDVIEIGTARLLARMVGAPVGIQPSRAPAPVRAPITTRYSVTARGGAQDGAEFAVGDGVTRVGRDPRNEVALADPTVSAFHAEIRAAAGGHHLLDVGSTLGTRLNGGKVTDSPIAHGAIIEVGRTTLVFRDREQPAPAPAPSAAPRAASGISGGVRKITRGQTPSPDSVALLVLAGTEKGVRYEFREGATIGRHVGNQIVLAHPEVSNDHARLRRRKGLLVLEDLRSTNGTRVNDAPVTEAVLNHGDVIELGDTEFMLVEPGLPLPSLDRYDRPSLIRLSEEKKRGARYRLPVTFTLGRNPGHGVVLDDPEASGDHARIQEKDGGFVLVDLGSTNGTKLNGKRVTAEVRLRHGDQIVIGQIRLVFKEAHKSLDVAELRKSQVALMAVATLVLVLGIALITWLRSEVAGGARARANLLTVNAGFDDVSEDGHIPGWTTRTGDPTQKIASVQGESGRCLQVSTAGTTSPHLIVEATYAEPIALQPITAYHLRGAIRCIGAKRSGGAAFRLRWHLPDGETEDAWTEWIGATSKTWREVEVYARPPAKDARLEVSAIARGAVGIAEFDRVRLHAIALSEGEADQAPKAFIELDAADRFGTVQVAVDPRGLVRVSRGKQAVWRRIGFRVWGPEGLPRLDQSLAFGTKVTAVPGGAGVMVEGRVLDFVMGESVGYTMRVNKVQKDDRAALEIRFELDPVHGDEEARAGLVAEGAAGLASWANRRITSAGVASSPNDFPNSELGVTQLVVGPAESELALAFDPPALARGLWNATRRSVDVDAVQVPRFTGNTLRVDACTLGADTRRAWDEARQVIAEAEKQDPPAPGETYRAWRDFRKRFATVSGVEGEAQAAMERVAKAATGVLAGLRGEAEPLATRLSAQDGLAPGDAAAVDATLAKLREFERAYGGVPAADAAHELFLSLERARTNADQTGRGARVRTLLGEARTAAEAGNAVRARLLLESLTRHQTSLLEGLTEKAEVYTLLDRLDTARDDPAARAQARDLARTNAAARETAGDRAGALAVWRAFLAGWADVPGGDPAIAPEAEQAMQEISRLLRLR